MKQYLQLLENIVNNGYSKGPARKGMPDTIELFGQMMKFDLSEGFPILTCRKMPVKAWMTELCWLLKGHTTIKYLLDHNVHIWDADAYRFYKFRGGKLPKEEWLEKAKLEEYDPETKMLFGDLGKVYGYQWRSFGGMVDQIHNLCINLKNRPNSRYHIVTAWSPVDYTIPGMAALPACHAWFQCCINGQGNLDLMLYQRSCDMVLGVPFDIVEYAALTHLLAYFIGTQPGTLTWVGGSCHIYKPHMDAVQTLIGRKNLLYSLPEFEIVNAHLALEGYEPEDFELHNYKALPAINAELFVGC